MSVQLVICGMHRSGTSLVSNVMREAGLDIGVREDVGLGVGQPRGHFEDREVFRLHEAILAASGRTCFTADDASLGEIPAVFQDQARALVAARADRPFWGWKDPRTCLFLDLWDGLLPEARYLFLYRHPVDVALSLWRRNTDPELSEDPWLALRAWKVYNRRILAFRDRHPERCFVAHAPALTADLAGFVRAVAIRLDLPLREDGDFGALYDVDELAPSCPLSPPAWEKLIPEALALYDRLEELAGIPSAAEPAASSRQRGLVEGSEILLRKLLEARLEEGTVGLNELVRLRLQETALREQLAAAENGTRILMTVLQEIEGSRSFAVIRAWWRLRRRLAEGGRGSADLANRPAPPL